MPVLDLERLVDAKGTAELQQMNGRLEVLVADAIDRQLGALVRDLMDANLAGRDLDAAVVPDAHPHRPEPDVVHTHHEHEVEAPTTRRCNHCQQVKPVADFARHRGVCRACRNAAIRRHRATAREATALVPLSDGDGSPSTPSS